MRLHWGAWVQECAHLQSEMQLVQEEVDALATENEALRERQSNIEREADLAAELLLAGEGHSDMSATALVKEALAHRGGSSLTATALVRDALAQHVRGGVGSVSTVRGAPSLDVLLQSWKGSPATTVSPSVSPAAPRLVSFVYGVDKAAHATMASATGEGKGDGGEGANAASRQLAAENTSLHSQLVEMQGKVGLIQGQLDTALAEREELLQRTKKIEQAADRDIDTNLRISISEANRRVAEVQMQLTSAVAERDEARRVCTDLKAMMGDVLQRQSADMQQQSTQSLAEYQRLKKEADEGSRVLQQELEIFRRQCQAMQADNAALLQWKQTHETDRERNRRYDREVERGRSAEVQQEIDDLHKTNSGLRLERTNLLKERQALLLRSDRLALERENANTEIERLKCKVEELEAKHAAACEQLTLHCDKFDGMLLQAREAWQRQLDDADQTQCKLQDQSASQLDRDRERAELCRNIQRLRECNRLVILELEDTRERLLDERRRRHAAEYTAVAAQGHRRGAAADVSVGTQTIERSLQAAATLVLPPVEETPGKAQRAFRRLPAPEDTMSASQFQKLLNGCVTNLSAGHTRFDDKEEECEQEHHAQERDNYDDAGAHSEGQEEDEETGNAQEGNEVGGREGKRMLSAPSAHPSLPLPGEDAHAAAQHLSATSHSNPRTRSPSPEPQWFEPAGLQASALNGRWAGGAGQYGRGADSRLDYGTPQHHTDFSVMNLSNAAIRQLSREPEEKLKDTSVSVIGLSRSAVREASMPPDVTPNSASLHQPRWQRSNTWQHPVSALRQEMEINIKPRQKNSKALRQGPQSASRPVADRKPLSVLSRSDINGIHALRGV